VTSHYRLDAASPQIAAAFDADAGPDPWGGGALYPGTFAPVIVRSGRTQRAFIRPMHWGYPPPGSSTEAMGPTPPSWVAQVRNVGSPFWIGNLRHTELRCLIPATAFALRHGKADHHYSLTDRSLFAFAGIWRDLTDMPVFALLTTEPCAALLPIEGGKGPAAMPVILAPNDHTRWLSADWKEAQKLVRPYPSNTIHTIDGGAPCA
jgi:putative SOS response-associated peptidase YedK